MVEMLEAILFVVRSYTGGGGGLFETMRGVEQYKMEDAA